MRSVALALALGAVFGFGLAVGLAAAPDPDPDPFEQGAYPCQEDEVLTYAPRFGPDRVGCVHWDELPRMAE